MNKSKWFVPGIVAGIVLLFVLIIGGSYNGLVNQREQVRSSLSNIQTQYQRRSDLVPNLVNTVKGSANFEQQTLNDVVTARSKATSISIDPSKSTPAQLQQYQQSQGELSQALGKLLAITENYPDLKTTAAFRDLQVQLEGTENRIAVARRDYNDTARSYNAKVQKFPSNVTAGLFHFDSYPYFQATPGSDKAPTVNFH